MIAAGARRLIPDDQTLKLLLAGQTVRVLSDVDLAAIPLGAPMPSRKDGLIVSQDFGGPVPGPLIFYFMANGLRRFIPDLDTVTGFRNAGAQFVHHQAAGLSGDSRRSASSDAKGGYGLRGDRRDVCVPDASRAEASGAGCDDTS
jgi:hypothetical protein